MTNNSNKQGMLLVLFIIIIGVGVIIYNRIDVGEKARNEKKKEKIVINGDSNYNIRLIKEVNKTEKKNYLISPYSIRVALNMLAEGANNETEEEVRLKIELMMLMLYLLKINMRKSLIKILLKLLKRIIKEKYYLMSLKHQKLLMIGLRNKLMI